MTVKTVGILTFHFSENFGALLQAYALRRWFVEQGCSTSFITYFPEHVEQGGAFRISMKPQVLRANLKIAYLKAAALLHHAMGSDDQERKFAEFRRDQLGIDEPSVGTLAQLADYPKRFDLYVAGSDQIWSPSVQYGFDPAYFLDFVREGAGRRIAYAASFGTDSLPQPRMSQLSPLLRNLDAVSVRELSGVQIVRTASGIEPACVPDPTLLHTEYDELLTGREAEQRGHVFCYALRTGEHIRDTAHQVARAFGAEVISPYNIHRRWREIGRTVHPGPIEWLSHVRNSAYVVTNSFHGAVFSILFQKPFVVVGLPGARSAMNARSKNLLGQLGLMDRFLERYSERGVAALLEAPIEWSSVAQKQRVLRLAGVNYLSTQLGLAVRHE